MLGPTGRHRIATDAHATRIVFQRLSTWKRGSVIGYLIGLLQAGAAAGVGVAVGAMSLARFADSSLLSASWTKSARLPARVV